MNQKAKTAYTGYLGPFDYHHKNPPTPFNPDYDPAGKRRYAAVTSSMEADDYYKNHSLEECRVEWNKRHDELKRKSK